MKKRGRPPKPNSNYFPELEMVDLLKTYKISQSEEVFRQLEPKLVGIINGMINKEFRSNPIIINNRNDCMSECMFEIFKSYRRYDPEKGRLYAYTNRIVKNTLLKYYEKSKKRSNNETTYTDINASVSDEEQTEDNVFKINLISTNEMVDDVTEVSNGLINCSLKNITLDMDTSINIIYNYVKYVKEALDKYLKNKDLLNKLVNDINYDVNITFDLTKYYNSTVSIDYFYYNLIENSSFVLNSLMMWIERSYKRKIHAEPLSYDGNLSSRAVGYVRRFIVTSFEDKALGVKIDSDELVEFIKYITLRAYIADSDD